MLYISTHRDPLAVYGRDPATTIMADGAGPAAGADDEGKKIIFFGGDTPTLDSRPPHPTRRPRPPCMYISRS